jgi:hypothetical protein
MIVRGMNDLGACLESGWAVDGRKTRVWMVGAGCCCAKTELPLNTKRAAARMVDETPGEELRNAIMANSGLR